MVNMTTILEAAAHLGVAPAAVSAVVDQLADDPALWDERTSTLTTAGMELVTGEFRESNAREDTASVLADISEVADRIRSIEDDGRDARDERDALIQWALSQGVPYAAIGDAAGLSRSALDTIRRGERHRK